MVTAERSSSAGVVPDVPRRNPARFVIVLGILQTIAPLSVDMYLPALPSLQHAFAADQSAVQLTLSSFLIGFGGGQLFWGPVSDRFGRRGPMAAGLLVYIGASLGCAYAGSVWQMVAWRFAQAIGGCAPAVLVSAMVRDLYDAEAGARVRSLMGLVGLMAPLLAPIIGGQILSFFTWPVIFEVLACFGVASLGGLLLVPETLTPSRRSRLHPFEMVLGYGELFTHRRYLGYALSSGLLMAGMFAYISGTPFVYIEYFGVAPQLYGILFGVNIAGMVSAGLMNSRLVGRLGLDTMLRTGCGIAAVAGLVLAGFGRTGAGGLLGVAVPVFFFVSMMGLAGANAAAGALRDFPHKAGAAAALLGTLGNGLGALTGALVGWAADGTPWPMTAVMAAVGVLALGSNLLLLGHAGRQ